MLQMQRGHFIDLAEQIDSQDFDSTAIMDIQSKKLKELLAYSYRYVPYYKHILKEAGVIRDNGEIYLDRFQEVPILNKEILRAKYFELQSDIKDSERWIVNTSGGSTGEPVFFIQDEKFNRYVMAVKCRYERWAGYRHGEPRLLLWGSPRDLTSSGIGITGRLKRFMRNLTVCNTYTFDPVDVIERLNKHRPVLVEAYVESIYETAVYLLKKRERVYQPKGIIVSAGTLHEHMEDTIKKAFPDSVLLNRYGSREVGDVACYCPEFGRLHVSDETHVVEVLDDNGEILPPGEEGEIVITVLNNFAMPFIRYKIGDRGIIQSKKCRCGRHSMVLEKITGRSNCHFLTPKGHKVNTAAITVTMYNYPWIKRYQIIQESLTLINVYFENSGIGTEDINKDMKDIKKEFKTFMGEDVEVKFVEVMEVPRLPSGKFVYFYSKVNQN